MAKEQRATDKLNLAISGIEASATVLKTIINGLPEDAQRGIKIALEQIEESCTAARAALRIIKKAAETI